MTRFEFRLGTLRRLTDDWVRELTYDALNMQSTVQRRDIFGNLDEDFLYIYGPGNYRLFVWDGVALKRHFTLRDLNAKPLREMEVTGFGAGAVWTHQKDFLHGPSGLVATRTATGLVKYFHHDHLGTPRLLTSAAGSTIASFHYYPFGEPATFPENPNADPAYKFTGHERDRSKVTDYMLGRTYAFPFQRFMQVDPARDGWNLYGYVGGNPVAFADLDGQLKREITFVLVVLIEFDKNNHRTAENTVKGLANGVINFGLLAEGKHPMVDEDFQNLTFAPETPTDAREQLLGPAAVVLGASLLAPAVGSSTARTGAPQGAAARTPVGRNGNPLNVAIPEGRTALNSPTTISGRQFSGHALDRLQGQGIPPSVVEGIIRPQNAANGKVAGTTAYYDPANHMTVITDTASGRVVTVDFGQIRQ
jgi:RHS repeat-associated protein